MTALQVLKLNSHNGLCALDEATQNKVFGGVDAWNRRVESENGKVLSQINVVIFDRKDRHRNSLQITGNYQP